MIEAFFYIVQGIGIGKTNIALTVSPKSMPGVTATLAFSNISAVPIHRSPPETGYQREPVSVPILELVPTQQHYW